MSKQMTRREFTELLSRLRARYQNAIADADMWLLSIEEYWGDLRSFDSDALRHALRTAHRVHPQWMPSCGQLIGLLQQTQSLGEVWPEVVRLASRSDGEHSDPIAREAIRQMGGGKRLGAMTDDELHVWGRKQFEELYQQIEEKRNRDPGVLELPDGGADKLRLTR